MTDIRMKQVEDVRGSDIYPATGPFSADPLVVRNPAALARQEKREVASTSRQSLETAALIAGRVIFGGYFLYSGINHFLNRKMLSEYARRKGTAAPDVAVLGSGALIVAGGLSILLGTRPKIGSALISTFLI